MVFNKTICRHTVLFSLLCTSGWRQAMFNSCCLFIFQHVATLGFYFSGIGENQFSPCGVTVD